MSIESDATGEERQMVEEYMANLTAFVRKEAEGVEWSCQQMAKNLHRVTVSDEEAFTCAEFYVRHDAGEAPKGYLTTLWMKHPERRTHVRSDAYRVMKHLGWA